MYTRATEKVDSAEKREGPGGGRELKIRQRTRLVAARSGGEMHRGVVLSVPMWLRRKEMISRPFSEGERKSTSFIILR